ncbi:MAG: Mu-like prophage protein, partial [Acidobacteria bacterium]|nr:Mu-like prophage protein [Acidobacteriota bacterium]
IPDQLNETILVDVQGDGVIANRQTFDQLVGQDSAHPQRQLDGAARAAMMTYIRPTLESPLEVWWSPRVNADGATTFTKTYISLYRDAVSGRTTGVFLVRAPNGWLMWTGFPSDIQQLEPLRRGYLSYRSYGRSKAAA